MDNRKAFGKNIFICILVAVIVLVGIEYTESTLAASEPPVVDAEASVVIDSKTGAITYSKNGELKKNPGSLTKVMTAIIVAESEELDDTQKSQIEKMLFENDSKAAETLAKKINPNLNDFYKKMNEKAKVLDCKNTNFVSVHGKTDSDEHYSTPQDMARIVAEFQRIDVLNEMLKFEKENKISFGLISFNEEQETSEYTSMVGKKGKTELISVTFGGATREGNIADNKSLLKYNLDNYRTYQVLSKNKSAGRIKIKGGKRSYVKVYPKKDLYVTLPKEGADSLVKIKTILSEDIKAPVKKGSVVGKIQAIEAGEVTAEVDAIVMEGVSKGGPWSKIGISDYLMVILASIIIISIFLRIIIKSKKKKKRRKIEEQRRLKREIEAIKIAQERKDKKKRDWPY